jgi:hypothetical protein
MVFVNFVASGCTCFANSYNLILNIRTILRNQANNSYIHNTFNFGCRQD